MASDLAIVFGFCGRMFHESRSYASVIGEQPSAWAPLMRVAFQSIRPSQAISLIPL